MFHSPMIELRAYPKTNFVMKTSAIVAVCGWFWDRLLIVVYEMKG